MNLNQSVTTVPITLYVPEDVHKALQEIAASTGRSTSDLVQAAFAIGFPKLSAIRKLIKKGKK